MTARSGIEPHLFYRFEHHLARAIFTRHLSDAGQGDVISRYWVYRILDYPRGNRSEEDLTEWLDDPRTAGRETFAEVVESALASVHRENPGWQTDTDAHWENRHTLHYEHPLGSAWLFRPWLNRGPYFMPGGRDCILTASFSAPDSYRVSHLSTFRMILDFSDFSRSLMIHSSGQSGHFLSPHYDDQIDLFVHLKYRKMVSFSGALRSLTLIPAASL